MRHSPERSLARFTVPLGMLLAAGLSAANVLNVPLWDALNRALPDRAAGRVVVVAIDDASLQDYGRLSSWPRGLYTQAIRTLEEAGASSIGLDILLDAPSSTDEQLQDALTSPSVVLAAPPGQALPTAQTGQKAAWGISALNASADGVVRYYQRGYRLTSDGGGGPVALQPSLAFEVARKAGATRTLNDAKHILRFPAPEHGPTVLSFRDVVNGNVRYADIQGRAVLIGLSAAGGPVFQDVTRTNVPGVVLQARAVSSMLGRPLRRIPVPWAVLAGALITGLAVWLRGLWAYWMAFALLGVSVALWSANVLFPGVTLSLAAMLGSALVVLERVWNLRTLGLRDPLTGFGNRVAFNRALDRRWHARPDRPTGLILVDLSGFRRVNEQLGRAAGDAFLKQLGTQIGQFQGRNDLIFRWGADEFALLMDNVTQPQVAQIAALLQAELGELTYQGVTLRGNIGAAAYGPDISIPQDLVEAASRQRYRQKYAGTLDAE